MILTKSMVNHGPISQGKFLKIEETTLYNPFGDGIFSTNLAATVVKNELKWFTITF